MKTRLQIFLACVCLGGGLTIASAEPPEADQPFEMVGQELDAALLENLPAPTEPPARVRLHTRIEKDQWQSSQSGITEPSQGLFRRQSSWGKFWNLAVRPYNRRMPETPPIDFGKEMVVGVFMGSKTHPGFQIEIQSIEIRPRGDQQVLEVTYKNISKMQSVFTPPFVVQPFHLRTIPVFSGVVLFQETK